MVPPRMVQTPWGDSSRLREKTLPPGRGTTAEEAAQNHRERLFGALVAKVAEKGYEATTVADLVELSGVSRAARSTSISATNRSASWRRSRH